MVESFRVFGIDGDYHHHDLVILCLRYHELVRYPLSAPKGWDRTGNAGNAGKGEVLQRVGDRRLRPPAGMQEFAADHCRRSGASRGSIFGRPDRHRLSHALRGSTRAAATTRATWILLMMRSYL